MTFGRLIDPYLARVAREADLRRVVAAERPHTLHRARVLSDLDEHRERVMASRRPLNLRLWTAFKQRGYSVAWKYLFDAWPVCPALELDHESFCAALMLDAPSERGVAATTRLELAVLRKLHIVTRAKAGRAKLELLHVKRANKTRTQLLLARPWWVDRNGLREVYGRARAMNELVGYRMFEVRHVVNLGCAHGVCGLHVPWNLRITRIAARLPR